LDLYTLTVAATGVIAGLIAAVSGFGIGSLLTPVLAFQLDTRLAIAAVSVPHLIGTAQRFWTMRHNIDRPLLLEFGVTSAIGGLERIDAKIFRRSLGLPADDRAYIG